MNIRKQNIGDYSVFIKFINIVTKLCINYGHEKKKYNLRIILVRNPNKK